MTPTRSGDGSGTPTAGALDWKESSALLRDPVALRERFAGEGFLFVRGLLPAAAVGEVRSAVLSAVGEEGWLADGTEPDDRRPGPLVVREADDRWWPAYQRIQSLECFHRLAYHEGLVGLARHLLEGRVLVHPRKIARLTFPGSDYPTPAHQDFPLIQGSPDVLTIWLPLAECSAPDGALRVLARSQRQGLRVPEPTPGVGGVGVPVSTEEANDWVSPAYRPGDALVFHSLTVHWAPPNCSGRLRLSCDFRYQRADEPVVAGSLLPHYWPTIPGWEVLSREWSTTRWVAPPPQTVMAQMQPPLGDLVVGPVRLVRTGER